MKNTLILFLFSIICVNLTAQFVSSGFAGGEGTEDKPYLIATYPQLRDMAKTVNDYPGCSAGKYFKLTNDINLAGNSIQIGNSASPFEGTFDGAKYRLVNLHSYNDYAGLFGNASGATIRRLTIDGGRIYNEYGTFGGSLIGIARLTTVDSCFIRGVDMVFSGQTGGLIGYAIELRITDCSFSGTVVGIGQNTGGLIGHTENCTITRCFSEGSVAGSNNTGGFIGIDEGMKNVSFQDCFSSSKTTGIGYVGGFIGSISSSTAITRCYATGTVSGQSQYVGGFIGTYSLFGTSTGISDCYSTGAVINTSGDSGGFIGYARDLTINRCYAAGSVTGKNTVGGFIGFSGNSFISGCYAVGTVERVGIAADPVVLAGSFIGYSFANNLSGCFAAGAVINENLPAGVDNESFSAGFIACAISTTGTNCFFDVQATGLMDGVGEVVAGNLSGIKGVTTTELTKSALPGFSSNWIFKEGYYPQLEVFTRSANNAATRLRSALSVVPLKLANDTESVNDVHTIFSLADKTPANDIITWTVSASEKITIFNNAVYAEASDEWRNLTIRAGEMERTFKFRAETGLLAAEILGVRINHETTDIMDAKFTHRIECGSKDESVFAELIIPPYANSTPGSPIILYANIPQDVTVTSIDGKDSTYTFLAEKHLASDIFVQRWDDVLAINNNFATNGGYIITDYEWEKDGNPLPDAKGKGYIYEPDGLSNSAVYIAKLTTQHGVINTCPAVILNVTTKMSVYPNPVQSGQSIYVETGISADKPAEVLMQLFNTAGNIIAKQTLHDPVAGIAMPYIPGQYILQITVNGATYTYKIAVE